ncbi:MAG TPA: hypothetical protein VKV40_05655 [Ktedonobacteraceae bacterium]|nr:hypothetical protein [Ktedonobacteraceae bacterium]
MQQAYRALRVVAEAETIRMVLSSEPDEFLLDELVRACTLYTVGSDAEKAGEPGVKAIILDFIAPIPAARRAAQKPASPAPAQVEQARQALQELAAPVLAVVHTSLSPEASVLAYAADLLLVAHDALLTITDPECRHDRLTGEQAARLGYVTWSAPASGLKDELERILDMLRDKSAIALRHARAATRLGIETGGQKEPREDEGRIIAPSENGVATPYAPAQAQQRLSALDAVNAFYLATTMHTEDAQEGLRSFLEKREPLWKNR